MSDLLFVRHAETDMAGTFCGHADPSVNGRGKQQIRDLLQTLDFGAIGAVYCSDLQRAVQTADAISIHLSAPIYLRPGLREIAFGDWEGLRWHEVEQRDHAYAKRWIEGFPNIPAPAGEPFRTFEARVLHELNNLLQLREHRRIAVVTHGGVMRVALRRFCEFDEQDAWRTTSTYCSHFVYLESMVRS